MKTATLLSLAATAFVLVSAAPREAKIRSTEPEPYPDYDDVDGDDDDDDDDSDNSNDPNNSPPTAGVMCGITGASRVAAPDITAAQAVNGFIGQINAKKGSINGPGGDNTCKEVSCADGVGVSFCNDSPFPSTVAYSTIGKYAYDLAVVCFDGGKTNNGRKTYIDLETDNRWYITIGGATC